MKIVEIIASLDVGGAERALAQRLRFQPKGAETTVIHGPPRTDKQIRLPETARQTQVNLSRRNLRREIEAECPDVVIVHNPLSLIRLPKRTRCRQGALVVFVAHAAVISERKWKAFLLLVPFRLSLRKSDTVVAVSGQAGRQVGGGSEITVVPLGSELDSTAPEPSEIPYLNWLEGATIKFLVLARLTRTKNIANLLKAIGTLSHEFQQAGARLLIVGDGPEKPRLEEMVRQLDLCFFVLFAPTTNSPSSYLRASDYLVIVSTSEGGPLTAYEALLAGTTLISTEVGVVPEISGSFPESVLLCKGSDEFSIRTALQQALDNDRRPSITKVAGDEYSAESCARTFYATLTRKAETRTSTHTGQR